MKEGIMYIVLKLVTGETLMATYEGEDDKFVKIDYPVQIRTVLIPELNKESVSAVPFCPFSESKSFVLEKSHLIYIKRLNRSFIPHYKNFVKMYDEAMVPATLSEEDLEELEGLTVEEIAKRIEMLEAIAKAPSREENLEEEFRTFVLGNDTKH